ncbi:transporter, dicarboxylate/amino acid:cation Na+/H+ symporter family protein [Peptoanaerobacter stomatis]|uniref:Transporter, dicarboxylate/amino acid:cation Na+/H+ symporter family protein n=1 Tax=Peptoanaerobacter stomatis TaxID=796937 RepID=J5U3H6_9FIRM|nr:dicarboxylate/amino acid:cation symporter [Peptoanaerobacter stomatis]EJU19514.1 transporter, dicarboxylate/amino acid:cation Na+/H+ symporter family protein [Peptoanaerobacter stomatis]
MSNEKKDYLIVKLILGVIIGIIVGMNVNESIIQIFMSLKQVLGQIIFYAVPLIIVGFITPAITGLKQNANKLLSTALFIAYLSSIGAAFMSMIMGYILIPGLNISSDVEGLRELPEMLFSLKIDPMFSVMTALVTSILFGLAIIWTKSQTLENIFNELNNVMMEIVKRVIVPILPFFIASTFACLAYEGGIIYQLPVFLKAIVIVIVMHYIWLFVLYSIGGGIAKANPLEVIKHYGPAYLTALGTMSSAATLPMSLECARKSSVLDREIADFAIPIGATIHLCGSVLTEVFFVMTVSKILTGSLPSVSTMILFILLLGIFAIGAPGVPGGTVMASLGLIISVIGFDQNGTALMLTIFALQDSFGTACNVTGDGAIALMLTGLYKKQK